MKKNFAYQPSCIALLLFLVFCAERLSAQTIYLVDADKTGNAASTGVTTVDAAAWNNACGDLQTAIDAAEDGSQIWVKAGTYKPSRDPFGNPTPTDPRDKAFYLKSGVRIYGGFEGNETSLNQRDTKTRTTILSGDIGTPNDNTDNSYHVVLSVNAAATTTLDGFTITGGKANGNGNITISTKSIARASGGGIFSESGSLQIINAIISENNGVYGGGLALNAVTAQGEIINTMVRENSAYDGGGIISSGSSPTFINCLLAANTATHDGGGIHVFEGLPVFTNVTVVGNSAVNGGGINLNASNATLTNSIIWENNSGLNVTNAVPVVSYSVIQNGYAGTGNLQSDPLLDENYHLQLCSPALDAGTKTVLITDITTDLAGNARVAGTMPDMGAFEFQDISAAPKALSTQSLANGSKVADLTASGTALKWYSSAAGGSALSASDALTATTYFLSQQAGTCESTRTPVTVTLHNVRFVKPLGLGNGSSWANASGSLNSMINLVGDGQVWVAAGIYTPKTYLGEPDSRQLSFLLPKDTKVYGGFSGNETVLEQRDWVKNVTVMSGDLGLLNNNTDNVYSVVTITGEAGTAILDGFTISGGNANAESLSKIYGGGLYIASSSPQLKNLIVRGNAAYYGGGFALINSSAVLTNVAITGNQSSGTGGGIFNFEANPTFINSMISGNSALSGGGVSNATALPKMINTILSGNKANQGAGILDDGESSSTLINCVLSGNGYPMSAPGFGVGEAIRSEGESVPVIRNTIIYANRSGITNTSQVSHSLVQGLNTTDNGNIAGSTNPLFLNAPTFDGAPFSHGDYHLQSCSPAINKGDNSVIPDDITFDLAGNLRIEDFTVDMGVYEDRPLFPQPVIFYQPKDTVVCVNNGAGFSVTSMIATSYRWQLDTGSGFADIANTIPYSGVSTSTLSITTATVAMNGYRYRCLLTDVCNVSPTISEVVTLYVTNIRYVKPEPTGNGKGNSWENASADLQLMINQTCAGDEIWVAAGTYKPLRPINYLDAIGVDSRNNAFVLKKDVQIYGGFTGTETSRNQRNWEDHVTTLSGDLGVEGQIADNACHVVVCAEEPGTGTLNGFFIKGGNAKTGGNAYGPVTVNGKSIYPTYGGGIYVAAGSWPLSFLDITANSATEYGGGIYMNAEAAVLSHINIHGNSAATGGGILNLGGATLTDVAVTGNTATNSGGGIASGGYLVLTRVNIDNNSAEDNGGGLHHTQYGTSILSKVTLTGNTADNGGGFYNSLYSSCSFSNVTVGGNSARIDGGGGYISEATPSTTLTNVLFKGNKATGKGGALYNEGNLAITNSTISGNSGSAGGAFYNTRSSAKATIKNTLMYGNSSGIENNSTTLPIVSYSLVQDGYAGTANLSADPLFTDAPAYTEAPFSDGDYSLQPCSPAINAGYNAHVPSGTNTDLANSTRIKGSAVDIGAYEFVGTHNGNPAGADLLAIDGDGATGTVSTGTTFQAGASACRTLATILPNGLHAVSGQVAVKAWESDELPAYYSIPFVRRYYDILPADDASTATAQLTLYFTQNDFDDFNENASSGILPTGPENTAGKASLRIYQFHGSPTGGNSPSDYAVTPTIINPNDSDIVWNDVLKRWEVSFDVTGFSGFFVGSIDTPLPVKLMSFTGRLTDAQVVELEWKVTEQQNIALYAVEYSRDARSFTEVGTVYASTLPQTTYQYHDTWISGIKRAYYRLRIMETDGSFAYSRIISILSPETESTKVYPNPASSTIWLNRAGLSGSEAKLTDLQGRILKRIRLDSDLQQVDITALQPGVYFIVTAFGEVLRFLKE